jgi:hypothetical protein
MRLVSLLSSLGYSSMRLVSLLSSLGYSSMRLVSLLFSRLQQHEAHLSSLLSATAA